MLNKILFHIFFSFEFSWLQECPAHGKSCPTCKTKAMPKDIRILFARRVNAIDKSEEYRLQDLVDVEKTKNSNLENTISTLRLELAILKEKYTLLETSVNYAKTYGSFIGPSTTQNLTSGSLRKYRMSLEKNLEINREVGCRAMVYGHRTQLLFVSQKSSATLFPGYGVRLLNANCNSIQLSNSFLNMSTKEIRDLSLDNDEELLVSTSMDKSAKMFSVPNKCPVSVFTPAESHLWAVAFDKIRTKNLYLGSQQGTTYMYDIRNPQTYVEQFVTLGDIGPVVSIASVPFTDELPFGGIIVCKLHSIWFYEYTAAQQIVSNKLIVEGPFVSVSYDDQTKHVVIATRPNSKYKQARFIVATLIKLEQMVVLNVVNTILGSATQLKISRCTQIKINDDILLAAYLQDKNLLTTWNSKSGMEMQALNIPDVILDTCPIYIQNKTYLATLSETRCRIYQMNPV